MRILLFCLFAVFSAPALGQEWSTYANARFGYEGAVPPGFMGNGESDNGDGEAFTSDRDQQALYYWGNVLLEDNLAEAVRASIGYAERDGSAITSQTIETETATFTGVMRERMFYNRFILLCDGESMASFSITYMPQEASTMEPVIQRLVKSFKPVVC